MQTISPNYEFFFFKGTLKDRGIKIETTQINVFLPILIVLEILETYTLKMAKSLTLPHEAHYTDTSPHMKEVWRELWNSYKEEYFDTLTLGD